MSSMIDRRFLDISMSVLGVVDEPPASPAPVKGTQWIVGDEPKGEFASATAGSLARYDGNKWKFMKPAIGQMELLNIATGKIVAWDGADWAVKASLDDGNFEPPVRRFVDGAGATLPVSGAEGESFLNTANATLYISDDSGEFQAEASSYAAGTRIACDGDHKIYTVNAENKADAHEPTDGVLFFCWEDQTIWCYDKTNSAFVKVSVSERPVTESHTLTANEATAKSFNLTNNVALGMEDEVLLFVCGVPQVAGVDFAVSGKAVSWVDKALKDMDLVEGDVFIVTYHTTD